MANNKIGSNSSSKSERKSAGNGSEVAEPKKTLASRKSIRLGTIVWAKLDGCLGGPALAFNRDHTKLVKGTADKLKAWAIKLLASSKSTKSRDVVLDEFPEWLQRSIDRIKDTNTKLKRIANEKKENRLSLFQGSNNKKEKKKNNSGEDDFTYGPRDCDIAVVDRIKAGTLDMDYFCLGCHVEIMGPCMEHPLFFGSLCNRECKNELLATSYSIGEDDIHVSCAICGSTGNCLNILEQFLRQLRSFLHQDLPVQLNRHLSKKGQPALRVVVLHDNLGAVNYALNSLRLELGQYWAYDRWDEVYELNGVKFAVLKNANKMKDEEWAKLCPVHLLVSCLPAKKFDPKRHQPAGREVGRRQFSEGEYGEAFFDFFHVKNCIERNNEETPLLWAVENVASYHIIISRWTNIPEQNFNPQLEQVINNDHSSISCLPLSREPFFIKYPWILEDIVEKHDRMLFQRDTRSKMKTIKAPAYLEHYSVVQLNQKTAKKKRKLSSDLRPCWKLRKAVGSADENSDGISDETGHFIAALTDHATYARSLGFPEPFPQYVSHLEEAEVQERLNRSLPVSLWIHFFQPLLKLARVVDPK
ncbi:hypothetical protein DAPPUDRAFT_116312 [Daphnia pulex]|uniref:DNMT3 cysteine rich ADD domain-containing protein n=1 Tax=Daphnia pulex TaxID=6669 RepID=E9HP03_DAPPU|nr:hypothetical protein DAPPUDRAFT_116312 [Daphnia pulex]|eukprot:EFX66522.1 hypothetical protein DAPPUDRAFT_116312 [Daphnia pulex]